LVKEEQGSAVLSTNNHYLLRNLRLVFDHIRSSACSVATSLTGFPVKPSSSWLVYGHFCSSCKFTNIGGFRTRGKGLHGSIQSLSVGFCILVRLMQLVFFCTNTFSFIAFLLCERVGYELVRLDGFPHGSSIRLCYFPAFLGRADSDFTCRRKVQFTVVCFRKFR